MTGRSEHEPGIKRGTRAKWLLVIHESEAIISKYICRRIVTGVLRKGVRRNVLTLEGKWLHTLFPVLDMLQTEQDRRK